MVVLLTAVVFRGRAGKEVVTLSFRTGGGVVVVDRQHQMSVEKRHFRVEMHAMDRRSQGKRL